MAPNHNHTDWTGDDHHEFYQQLRGLSQPERSRALIEQSKMLLSKAAGEDHDVLKAAESLMGFWLLHVRYEEDRFQANQVLRRIYEALGEKEKAQSFR